MAAKGLFVRGFTADEVKAIQAKAKTLLLEGKTIMSWNDGGGTSVTKQMVMPVSEILEECAYALRRLEPTSATPNTGAHDAPGSFVSYRLPQ